MDEASRSESAGIQGLIDSIVSRFNGPDYDALQTLQDMYDARRNLATNYTQMPHEEARRYIEQLDIIEKVVRDKMTIERWKMG